MDPDPHVDQRSGRIALKKLWFFECEKGTLLLDCFRRHVTPSENALEAVFQFHEVLGLIKEKHLSPKTLDRKDVRASWRMDRINLYDNLFLILLGAEDNDWEQWNETNREEVVFEDRFSQRGSIYKYLLDYIHEHDDIMFKFYHAKESNNLHRKSPGLNKAYFWFYLSMVRYRMCHISPVLAIMKNWNEEDEKACQELLKKAAKEFMDNISRRGAVSWRYKVRMCWLLSRFQNASIRSTGDGASYKYKNPEYIGSVGFLCQKIIAQEHEMLLENDQHHSLFDDHPDQKVKFADKVKKDTQLGILHYSSLLAYACAGNDLVLAKCILKSKKEFEGHPECDSQWDKRWEETWAKGLWNAAYKGHGLIVKELILGCSELDSVQLYSGSVPPLHVAVRRGHESVVNAFCTAKSESNIINCHEVDESSSGYTPLEVATHHLKDEPDKKKRIQSILLNKPEVKRAVEESYSQRELTVGSANAIMVGAALIAGVTYAGWLQPPLGYHLYYQFTEPVPGAPDAPLAYMFVQGHMTIRMFAIFNSLSFFFAIAAIVAGMETTCFIGEVEETYKTATVKRLRFKLKRTRTLFIVSVIFVLIAFGCAGIAILPPIKLYQKDMYITIAVGGFVCIVFIGKMLLSKRRLYNRTKKLLGRLFSHMAKFFDACVPSPCKEGWKVIKGYFKVNVKYYFEEGS